MLLRVSALLTVVLSAVSLWGAREPEADAKLKHSYRLPEKNGWIYVHLEGTPAEIGYQHGYLLAPEIFDGYKVIVAELKHDTGKDFAFYRDAAEKILWPHIEAEYRQELEGMVAGLAARGVKLDLWDVVAYNASLELGGYYNDWWNKKNNVKANSTASAAEHCSAFVATGSYTKDGKPVIAHNAWTYYLDGERWRIVFDVVPAKGNHFLMDGFPGWIDSADDFGVTSSGLAITETTISRFYGFDTDGIPEFVRARKAMQYASSIDDFVRIMKEGNNGGYANNWLIADNNTNEIADVELGLKNVNVRRTKDGYFVGSNFPVNAQLAKEETNFDMKDSGHSALSRKARGEQLLEKAKGKVDKNFARQFLADHFDYFEHLEDADERTLCGHIDLSPRGVANWQPAYGAAGAAQNKIADSSMISSLSFDGLVGHACGRDFKAAEYLKSHPDFAWQKDLLHDMPAKPWTSFTGGQH